MPITIELREDGHVIYARITDPMTVADLIHAMHEQSAYYDNASHKLHQLVDVRQLKNLPNGILSMRRSLPALQHANRGYLVIIGANGFVRIIAETLVKLMQYEAIKLFSNETEAWAYLRKVIAEESQGGHETLQETSV